MSKIKELEEETARQLNQKTSNINVRLSPATKSDIITRAAELNLNISEYIEHALYNDSNSRLKVLAEQRKYEELQEEFTAKEAEYQEKITNLKDGLHNDEDTNKGLNIRLQELSNVIFAERIKRVEAERDIDTFFLLMKEAIISSEEITEQLDFFRENTKLNQILDAFDGEEFTYLDNGKKEKMIPETIEDVFSILVSDYHSKLGLHKSEDNAEDIESEEIE